MMRRRQQQQQQNSAQQQASQHNRLPAVAAVADDGTDWEAEFDNIANGGSASGSGPASRNFGPSTGNGGGNANTNIFSDDEDEAVLDELRSSGHPMTSNSGIGNGIAGSTSGGIGVDPIMTTSSYHVQQAENAMNSLKAIVRQDGWKKALKHKSGVVVYMKSGTIKGDKTPIFKGEGIIQGFSPQSIFYVIGMRKLWDEQYEDGNLVENLNETTSLTYEVTKASSTSRAHDLSLVEKIECSSDGIIIFAATSVETSKVPKIQGRVRSQIKLQGWILEPLRTSPQSTKVTFIIQENMKGWVPAFAKKSLARRPLVISTIDEYLQKKAERMRAQNRNFGSVNANNRRPSVMSTASARSNPVRSSSLGPQPSPSSRPPSIQTANPEPSISANSSRSNTTSTKKKISFAEPNASTLNTPNAVPAPVPAPTPAPTPAPPPSTPTSSHHILQPPSPSVSTSSRTSNAGESTAPSTPVPPRQTYPPHRHLEVQKRSMEQFKKLASHLENWTFHSEFKAVKIYTRAIPGATLPMLRGDGVVKHGWTAEQVCSVVQSFGARKLWDERFEDGRAVERFSQKEYLLHTQLRGIFPVNGRDLCAITTIETDPVTGIIFNVSSSVIDPAIPEDPKRVRAQMELSGWIFRPNFDDKGSTVSVDVTFISQVDFKGAMPSGIVRILTTETPRCVGRVEEYLQKYGCPPYIRRVAGKVVEEHFNPRIGTYELTYNAKHESSYKGRGGWCTDLRIGKKMYPNGFDVQVLPEQGVRVELAPDIGGVRVFTLSHEMEAQNITVRIVKNAGRTAEMTLNGKGVIPIGTKDGSEELAVAAAVAAAAHQASRTSTHTPSSSVSLAVEPVKAQLELQTTGLRQRHASNLSLTSASTRSSVQSLQSKFETASRPNYQSLPPPPPPVPVPVPVTVPAPEPAPAPAPAPASAEPTQPQQQVPTLPPISEDTKSTLRPI
ncbi:hypothetical protein BC938DRAFT_470717, partial [Jimgerdemannia flammicorona]